LDIFYREGKLLLFSRGSLEGDQQVKPRAYSLTKLDRSKTYTPDDHRDSSYCRLDPCDHLLPNLASLCGSSRA